MSINDCVRYLCKGEAGRDFAPLKHRWISDFQTIRELQGVGNADWATLKKLLENH